jgi:biopolymer transport protein ExbD
MESQNREIISRAFLEQLGSVGRRGMGLRMAPMIDVVFLLLIFFLVASNWRAEEDFLSMQLSQSNSSAVKVADVSPLIVEISHTDNGCEVKIAKQHVVIIHGQKIEEGLTKFLDTLQRKLQVSGRYVNDPVQIVCGEQVQWDYVAKIYNVMCGLGMSDITFSISGLQK